MIYYYRCIGSDNYRFVGGRVCSNRPIRADELDALVWGEVEQLLSDPTLIRAEIERRLTALRTESPAAHRRDGLERELARVKAGSARLIEAYQEQLITLDELRARMPTLRKRETTITAQLAALDAELHDAETYLQLAENLEGFLARLAENAQNLTVEERQRVVQLVVREVLIGDDGITIRHTIPTPTGPDDPSYLLRGSSPLTRACANVYLHRLDRQWAERGTGVLVRFADDLLAMCRTRQEAERALAALTAILAELGLKLKHAKTRIVHLREGGEGLDFLGFHHRWVRGNTPRSRHLCFLARWPSRQAMQRARDRIREITDRSRLLVPVETIVQDVNRFLRGWSGYFRYGNSARPFDKINHYAVDRLARFVAKRHKRGRGYGLKVVVYQSPDRLGLIDLNGTIVAPRPNRPWRPGR